MSWRDYGHDFINLTIPGFVVDSQQSLWIILLLELPGCSNPCREFDGGRGQGHVFLWEVENGNSC